MANSSTPTIVIVDDDRATLKAMQGMLSHHGGFQLHPVQDSREAMSAIRGLQPRLVLLDINMPHLDGYQIAARIRSDPATQEIAIVVISSQAGEEHARKCTALGISLRLAKPVDERRLQAAVEVALRSA